MFLLLYYVWQMVSQLSLHVPIDNLAYVIAKVADGIANQGGYNLVGLPSATHNTMAITSATLLNKRSQHLSLWLYHLSHIIWQ